MKQMVDSQGWWDIIQGPHAGSLGQQKLHHWAGPQRHCDDDLWALYQLLLQALLIRLLQMTSSSMSISMKNSHPCFQAQN